MELGKHLGKGIWGLADKGLPVFYGVAFVVLVIRVLPEEQFGNFVLVQEIFLIISGLAQGFALQPLLKFAAEENAERSGIISAGFMLNAAFTIFCALVIVAVRHPLSATLNSPMLAPLLLYVPAMLAASLLRNFTLVLLQTKFMIKEIFWIDAVHFLGAPLLVYIVSKMNRFDTAFDLIVINIISLSFSSIMGTWLSWSMLSVKLRVSRDDVQKLWDYGKYSLGGIVSFLFNTKSDSFILSAFAGPVQVAVYNSVKVFIRVYDMATQVVQMFVFPAVSNLSSKGEAGTLKVLLEKATLFTTVGMFPVFVLFLALASPLVTIVYQGRYTEAIPILQMFSVLSFIVPITAVATNALLGLGQARLGFMISVQSLVASIVLYLLCIPLFGVTGAAAGYILSSLVLAWLTTHHMNRFIPLTIREVLARTNDIKRFLKSRLSRA
ncbi:MAG: Polysacc synt protein [Bacteroidetes bacterium]|nr:Polysacc synt protein [Bacteroidota bacterium]